MGPIDAMAVIIEKLVPFIEIFIFIMVAVVFPLIIVREIFYVVTDYVVTDNGETPVEEEEHKEPENLVCCPEEPPKKEVPKEVSVKIQPSKNRICPYCGAVAKIDGNCEYCGMYLE